MTHIEKKPSDISILGSIKYIRDKLNYLGNIGDYAVGIFLSDYGFREIPFRAGNPAAYKNGRAKDLEEKLRGLVNMREDGLKRHLRMAEEMVRPLRQLEKSKVPNLGFVIHNILIERGLTSENFDEKSREFLEKLGKLSYLICLEASHFKRNYSPPQYESLINYLPKRMLALEEESKPK